MTKIKIESTETGDVFNMRMEPTIEKMKFQVSLLVPIPPHDQIMLIGPPYKILDSLYSPDMNVEGKRIFVFNRRILSDTAKEPQRIRLQPYEVAKPDLSLDHSLDVPIGGPQGADATNDSVLRTMEYEHYFQTQLKKAQCFEQYIQESCKTCKQSVAQHQVQLDGIGAAISNLQYFHRSIDKTYTTLEHTLSEQQSRHAALLGNFDASLQRLAAVPLHPALRAAIHDYQAQGASLSSSVATASVSASTTAAQGVTGAGIGAVTGGPAGGVAPTEFATLLDCIPVERERVYLAQCSVNHKKVDENLRRVRGLHQEVQAGVSELQLPQVDFEHLRNLLDSANQEGAAMMDLMRRFRRDYQFVYDHITMTASPRRPQQGSVSTPAFLPGATVGSYGSETQTQHSGSSPGQRESGTLGAQGGAVGPIDSVFAANSVVSTADSTLTSAPAVSPGDDVERVLAELQRRKNSQEGGHYLDQLEACARRVRDVKNEIERSQNWLLGAIYRSMRQIALLQTDIQYKLKRDVDWMKKLTQGQNEYFLHLEQIEKLPIIYQHLLNEIVRRRNYNVLFESEVIAASEKIAAFRREETRQREGFMQHYGLHLPPIFFKAIPTLKDKPPYFSPTLTDPQWLPEVSSEDVDRHCIATEFSLGVSEAGTEASSLEGGDAHKEALLRRFAAVGNEVSAMSHASEVPQSPLPTGALAPTNAPSQQIGERGTDSPHAFEPSTSAGEAAAHLGGSVILRAEPAAREETYQKLALQCSRLEYQNAQYVRIIAELLAERKGGQPLPDAISVALPPSAAPTPSKAVRTGGEPASVATTATAAATATAEDTATEGSAAAAEATEASGQANEPVPVPDAAQGPFPSTPSAGTSAADTELQVKLSKVGVLNQLMNGYSQLRRIITADAATQAYLKDLEGHGHIPPMGLEVTLYAGDETYIEHPGGQVRPIRDTIEAVTHAVHALVFGLNQQLSNPRISFMDFKAGDIALFLPAAAENRKIWMAYHASTPSRYLAEESLRAFENRNKNPEPLVRIMGRIVLIDTKVTTLEDNPFNLMEGSTYYVCYVEPLKLKGMKKRAAALAAPARSTAASVKAESVEAVGEVAAEGGTAQAAVAGLSLHHPTSATASEGDARGKEAGKEVGKALTPSSAAGTSGRKG